MEGGSPSLPMNLCRPSSQAPPRHSPSSGYDERHDRPCRMGRATSLREHRIRLRSLNPSGWSATPSSADPCRGSMIRLRPRVRRAQYPSSRRKRSRGRPALCPCAALPAALTAALEYTLPGPMSSPAVYFTATNRPFHVKPVVTSTDHARALGDCTRSSARDVQRGQSRASVSRGTSTCRVRRQTSLRHPASGADCPS